LVDSAVAVIDVLRATTSLTAAMDAGAAAVQPVATVRAAREYAAQAAGRGRPAVLAGERGGLRIPGFDLGNSPLEFDARVRGRTVVLTTTNGTRALAAAAPAPFVIAACFNNLCAAARALIRRPEPRILVLAAGEAGRWSAEDSLCAGLLIREMVRLARGGLRPARDLDRAAKAVYALAAGVTPAAIRQALFAAPHGRELVKFGFSADISYSVRLDATRTVGRRGRGGVFKIL
jgi:2-phosphosulfolactate phosphatase